MRLFLIFFCLLPVPAFDTSGMVTPMGKQRIYTGPMFEGGR